MRERNVAGRYSTLIKPLSTTRALALAGLVLAAQIASSAAPAAAAPAAKDGAKESASNQAIIALVNDEPITNYEVRQRALMLGGGDVGKRAQDNFKALIKNPKTTERLKAILNEVVKANEGKSRDEIIAIFEKRKKEFGANLQKQAVESARASIAPGSRKAAIEELIDEKIKLQEAKRLNTLVPDDEVNRVFAGIAERNKMTVEEFTRQIGGNADAMRTRIRAALSFNEVVRRRFGAQIVISSRDVDRVVAAGTATAVDDQVELDIRRIRIAIPAKLETGTVAKHLAEAEALRAKFAGCDGMGQLAASQPGAKFEVVGRQKPAAIAEPTRTMLLNAKDGEMLPPTVADGTVELWAVCGRSEVKAETQARDQAEGQLKQKEFELLAKRYLKDLRQDAHIEYR